jgi:hypothetical protein
MGNKPKVFVGSSSEARPLAEVFCDVLADRATMIPWWNAPEFYNGVGTLEALMSAVDLYDGGIFILSPDDAIESRGKKGFSARDNVLFEYGLFLGRLGRRATFAFIHQPSGVKKAIKVPSDLTGIHLDGFTGRDKHELISSIRDATKGIRDKLQPRRLNLRLMGGWGIENNTFTALIPAERMAEYQDYLQTNNLLLVVRLQDTETNLEDDTKIARSKPRSIGTHSGEITITVKSNELIGRAKPGTLIEGHLLLVPKNASISKARRVQDLLDLGARIVQSAARRRDA